MGSGRGRRAMPLFFLFLLTPAPLLRGESGRDVYGTTPWSDPRTVVVKDGEMAFGSGRLASDRSESVFFMCRFNGGWVFMANMFMSDAWYIDRWGVYALVTDPEGRTWWHTAEIPKRTVQNDANRLSVTDGNNTVESDGRQVRVRFRFDGFACDLTYRNLLPPWKAADGTIPLSADGSLFERWIMVSPWADVEGSMTLDGTAFAVKGQGYSDRNVFVAPLTKTNPILHSLRLYSAEEVPESERWELALLDSVTHPDFGSRNVPILLFAQGGNWIFSSHSYRLQLGPIRHVEGSGSGYPETLRISVKEAGYSLEGEFRTRLLFNQTDVFADLPPLVAAVLRLLFKRPVFFRTLGEFHGRLVRPDGSVTEVALSGPYEYVAVE